jgi:(p)ppGpp synthase/HD superfamily hydrolase
MKNLVEQARLFAAQAHKGQTYGHQPYTTHTDAVVDVLIEYNFDDDPELLASGHLHDVVEDCGVAIQEIQARFGVDVAGLVEGVTNEPGNNRKEKAIRTYPKIREDERRVALKLADRLANSRNAKDNNPGMFAMYRKEYPGFRAALRREDEFAGMWGELDSLFSYQSQSPMNASSSAAMPSVSVS